MMEGDPVSLDRDHPNIPEEVMPALQFYRAGSSALETELKANRREVGKLNASLAKSQAMLPVAKRLLSLARKELSEAPTAIDIPFRARMQRLATSQRKRIVSYGDLKKRLDDLEVKRRLALLDVTATLKAEDVQ